MWKASFWFDIFDYFIVFSFLFYCAFVFILIHIKALSIAHIELSLTVLCIVSSILLYGNLLIIIYFQFSTFRTAVAEINVRSWCPPLDHRTRPPCLTSSEGSYAFHWKLKKMTISRAGSGAEDQCIIARLTVLQVTTSRTYRPSHHTTPNPWSV